MDAQKFNSLLGKIKYNKKAVESIYAEYYVKLKAQIHYHFGKSVSAEDMAQEVFMKLMTMETPPFVEYPTTWLWRITKNYIIDTLRVTHPEVELLETQPGDFDIDRTILEDDVKAAMAQLDKLSQQIVYKFYWEGYSLLELTTVLNESYVNIRAKQSRAYMILRKYL